MGEIPRNHGEMMPSKIYSKAFKPETLPLCMLHCLSQGLSRIIREVCKPSPVADVVLL